MIDINDELLQPGRLVFAYRPLYYDEKKIPESDLHDIIRPYIILAVCHNYLICCTLTSKTYNKHIVFRKSKYKSLAYNSSPRDCLYKISKDDLTFITKSVLDNRDLRELNYFLYKQTIAPNNTNGDYNINEYFIASYLNTYPIEVGEIISFKDDKYFKDYFVIDIVSNSLIMVEIFKDIKNLYHVLNYNLVYFDNNIRYHRRLNNPIVTKVLYEELNNMVENINIDNDINVKKLVKIISNYK